MAINKNHLFEELDGIKCAIAETNASQERVSFLKDLLEYNGYKVLVVPSPPPKVATKPAATEDVVDSVPPPTTFTIGVTDVMFNPTNALMGRFLKTPAGHIVTPAYWSQQEKESHDEIPYYEHGKND